MNNPHYSNLGEGVRMTQPSDQIQREASDIILKCWSDDYGFNKSQCQDLIIQALQRREERISELERKHQVAGTETIAEGQVRVYRETVLKQLEEIQKLKDLLSKCEEALGYIELNSGYGDVVHRATECLIEIRKLHDNGTNP